METITNKEVNVRLDNEKGTLCLTGLLAGTMVFLYDSQGELKGKHKFAFPSLVMEIPQQGTYLLVELNLKDNYNEKVAHIADV